MKSFDLCTAVIGLTAIALVGVLGCGQTTSGPDTSQVADASHGEHGHEGEPMHGGWWCYEHGVPEEQCAMCDAKLASELREQGDWCEEHNRPESLCFKCDPSRAEKFVALYEAKFGEKPPAATE